MVKTMAQRGTARGKATTSWRDKTTRGQSNERMRRGDATTSWCGELTRGRHNERMTRGYATTSWHDEVMRRQRDERQHNLVVAMVVACIERKPEGWGPVIGHGIGGKYIPIMARLAKARRWSKR